MNDYDKRQLKLMLQKITFFRSTTYPLEELSSLRDDCEGLLDVLETIENFWVEECRSWCCNLEVVYAIALDRNKESLDEEDKRIVLEAIDNMEKMINELIIIPN